MNPSSGSFRSLRLEEYRRRRLLELFDLDSRIGKVLAGEKIIRDCSTTRYYVFNVDLLSNGIFSRSQRQQEGFLKELIAKIEHVLPIDDLSFWVQFGPTLLKRRLRKIDASTIYQRDRRRQTTI